MTDPGPGGATTSPTQAGADKDAAGRQRRALSERHRRERVSRRSALIRPGLLFDQIRSNIPLEPEPLGYAQTRVHADQVHRYFDTDLELFPDFFGGFLPREFFRIYRDEIEEKFATDGLARDLCGQLRHVMNKNFVSLILMKRLLVILTVIAVFAAISVYLRNGEALSSQAWAAGVAPWLRDVLACGAIMLIGLGAFAALNRDIFDRFEHKSSQSCLHVAHGLQSILKGIESAYRDAMERITKDENRGEREKDEWPERAAWWGRLILWYPKRVEYIEKAFQISMWRVRFWFAWCYIVGFVALIVIATVLVLATVWIGALLAWPMLLTIVFSAYVLAISALSYAYWRPRLSFVMEQSPVANWDRFSRFRVDERLAEMLREDRNKIIGEQRRHSGGHG